MSYATHLIAYLSIYLILAIGLNVIVGYAGLLTLAHAGYFALGAYAYAILSLRTNFGFLEVFVLSTALGAIGGRLMALLTERVSRESFVLLALAVQAWLFAMFNNLWSPHTPVGTFKNLTNGSFGIAGVRSPSQLGHQASPTATAALIALAALLAILLQARLLQSPWGRLLKAARDNDAAASGLGKSTRRIRAQALMVGCGAAAAAGVLYCAYVGYIDPQAATLDESIFLLSFVLVGGVGNIRGPLIGTVALLSLTELLRIADFSGPTAATLRLGAYGAALVLVMHWRPQGIAGEYRFE